MKKKFIFAVPKNLNHIYMNYFINCESLDEIKQMYRELAKKHHPDAGGDLATMQEVNKQYEAAIQKAAYAKTATTAEAETEILNSELYRNALNKVLNLPGLIIEVCGSWIWVSGETYSNRDALKAANFQFAAKKKQWYFRTAEHSTSNKKTRSMDYIRAKYGSSIINQKCLN